MAKSQTKATDNTSIKLNPTTTPLNKSKPKQDGEIGNITQPLDGNAPVNKIKLTCKTCKFETSQMKRSKAKQRLKSHIHAF